MTNNFPSISQILFKIKINNFSVKFLQNSNEIKKKDENFCSSYKFDDKKDKYTTQISKEMMNNNFILESNKENNTN